MIGQIASRERGGLYGAFAVRNPLGKGLALLVAAVLFVGCWQWSRLLAGPVGWADKGLYVRTAWASAVDPMLKGIPLLKLGRDESYPVIVERTTGWPLYTNEAKAVGEHGPCGLPAFRPSCCISTFRSLCTTESSGGSFFPVWLLWPVLLIGCLVIGQLTDMRRLRSARQSGVHLRGQSYGDPRRMEPTRK